MCDDSKPTAPYGHDAPFVPKITAENTTSTVSSGGKITIPVLSGTEIKLHIPAYITIVPRVTLYSRGKALWVLEARYWKDLHKFISERFLGDCPKDAFFAFGQSISRFTIML